MNRFEEFDPSDTPELLRSVNRAIHSVFIHCSASDKPADDDARVMHKWHTERGWREIGYHIFIRKDGTMQIGRHWNRTPAAQGGHNTGTLAICLHGLAEEKFTSAQFAALKALAAKIDVALGGVIWRGHREVSPKTCPVFDYKSVLNLDVNGFMSRTPIHTRTIRKMDRGAHVEALQRILNCVGYNLVIDGLFGRDTHEAVVDFQEERDLVIDGVVGQKTWNALEITCQN